MRVFGSDRIKTMMGRFGIPEDEPIENSLINRALENAQKKIEGFHFDARKYTLEYDNVLSHQRGIVYARRRTMLLAKREDIETYLSEFIVGDDIAKDAATKKRAEIGDEAFLETFRRIVLHVTDLLWVEHLETMEYLRSSVNLRAYGGREPLIEYQREGLRLFRDMENVFHSQVTELIGTIQAQQAQAAAMNVEPASNLSLLHAKHEETLGRGLGGDVSGGAETKNDQSKTPKVGRNEPCPCGSGKKFKHCHGQ